MSMQTQQHHARSIASKAIPAYLAAYPNDHRLQAALEGKLARTELEVLLKSAADVAEGFDGDQARGRQLFRATDAAEAVWLALHDAPDTAEVLEAVESALH